MARKLEKTVYGLIQVFGPYKRVDDREHVILIDPSTRSRKTVSYPKFLVQEHLGRLLNNDLETIDHIDGNSTNNDLTNLRIVNRQQHASEDIIRRKDQELICIRCDTKFIKDIKNVVSSKKKGKSGPFCSRSCQGKYGADIQNGRVSKLGNNTPEQEYHKIKDNLQIESNI
jgi:hypothetical protein